MGIIPARSTYFFAYARSKDFWTNNARLGDRHRDLTEILCGVTAGVVQNTITNPIWMVKTRMQVCICSTEYLFVCICRVYKYGYCVCVLEPPQAFGFCSLLILPRRVVPVRPACPPCAGLRSVFLVLRSCLLARLL